MNLLYTQHGGYVHRIVAMDDLTAVSVVETEGHSTDAGVGVILRDKVSVWVHLAITIVGFLTNPLIIVFLKKKKIGSKCNIHNYTGLKLPDERSF